MQKPLYVMSYKLLLIFIGLFILRTAWLANADDPKILIDGKESNFFDIRPIEIYGEKGNFVLCFECETCKNKKFQRLYLRGHLGRKID